MIRATVYGEAGGSFKTTTTANLAVALSRAGLDVIVIDLDSQNACLSNLFNVDEDQGNANADNLVKHMLDRPDGAFEDIIKTSDEGVDIIPSHAMFGKFVQLLEQKIAYETSVDDISRDEYPRYQLLYDLLWEREQIQNDYDAVLIDPNARAEDLLFNAIFATRALITPVDPSGKGSLSLEGLEDMVVNMENQLDIEIGMACVVPNNVGDLSANKYYQAQFDDAEGFEVPAVISERKSMMNLMWEARGSAFKVIEERWKRPTPSDNEYKEPQPGIRYVADREIETLQKIYEIARFVAVDIFEMDEFDSTLTIDIDGRDSQEFLVGNQEVSA